MPIASPADLPPLSHWEQPLSAWDLRLGPEEGRPGSFHPLDVDVRMGLGFNGFTRGPGGVFLAFLGWVGLDGTVDVGVYRVKGVTLGLGVEAFYDRPLLVERIGETLLNVVSREAGAWDIDMWHTGFTGRATVHFDPAELGAKDPPKGLDPYVVLLMGPRWASYSISYSSDNLGQGNAEYKESGLRLGAGGGLNAVSEKGLMASAELRYLVGTRFVTSTAVNVVNDNGDPLVQWEQQKWEQPPRGFSWTFGVGYRF